MVRGTTLALLILGLTACGDGGDEPICGDGTKNGADVCDGQDLAGQTCQSLGFGPGNLACRPNCADFDRSACSAPAGCGDGKLAAPELCDGSDLGGTTCESLGFGPGTLTCLANCADFDTSACGAPKTCGNGQRDGQEACDGSDLGGASCKSLGFDGGELKCAADCMSTDTSGCTKQCTPQCGNRQCGPDPVCGSSCGTCDAQSSCNADGQCVAICDLQAFKPGSTTLNLDLKTVTVSGTVTVNGKPMPDDPQNQTRGYLRFVDKDTGDYTSVTLYATGPANYNVQLFAGTYDVVFSDGSNQTVLPSIRTGLAQGLALTQNTQKSFDLKVVTVSGAVTVNGKPMPDDPQGQTRGYLRFYDKSTSDYTSVTLNATGPANYSAKLFAGTYDVDFSDGSNQTVLPSIRTRLAQDLALTQNTQKSFNLKTVTVSGTVTVNGKPMPDDPQNQTRGYLRFVDKGTSDYTSVTLNATGPATYSVQLFAGDHDVIFSDGSNQTVLPSIRSLLAQKLALTQNTQKSFDLKTVTVGGTVTVNGKAMPDDPQNQTRGYLRFVDRSTGDYTSVTLWATGPANYNVQLFAGNHDVIFSDGSNQTVLPSIRTGLAQDLALTQSTQKSFDLKVITVNGAVTVNGQAMPNDPQNQTRGYLRFVDRSTGDYASVSLQATGPANYSAKLFAGSYTVVFSDGSNQTVLPSVRHQLAQQLALQQSTQKSFNLETVTVTGAVTVNGKPMPDDPQSQTRGYLRFINRLEGDYLSATLGATGPASYSALLFAGTYDVDFSDGSNQTVLPALRDRLRTGCFDLSGCTASKSDLSGSWHLVPSAAYWTATDMTLKQSGNSVSGTWNSAGYSGLLDSGSRQGDAFTLFFNNTYCTVEVQGQLQSGCLITGFMQTHNCSSTSSYSQFVGMRIN